MLYPDLSTAKIIGVDIETQDPDLKTHGNNVYTGKGKILGVGISDGEFSEYYNLGHNGITANEREKNLAYIRDILANNKPKVFANWMYDADWLQNREGLQINGEINDIQIVEPLLNEYRQSYSLDALGHIYIGEGKEKNELETMCKLAGCKGDFREHLHKLPYEKVRLYGKDDPKKTVRIFEKQLSILKEQELVDVYRMEMRGLPLYLQMRKIGIRVDYDQIEYARNYLTTEMRKIKEGIKEACGKEINPRSPKDVEWLFKKLGIPFARREPTEKMREKGLQEGNPDFSKDTLALINHPVAKKIVAAGHYKTLLGYLESYEKFIVNGRIHCNFHPLRGDDCGTISRRLSCTKPNMQQVSGKDEEDHESGQVIGQILRKCFLPEIDHTLCDKDLSQIEYRFYAHFGIGQGVDIIREKYCTDRNADYHKEMWEITNLPTRKITKMFNFGSGFGMGYLKMAKKFGWSIEYAKEMYDIFHSKAPFIKKTMYEVGKVAKARGYIYLIDRSRARLLDPDKAYQMFSRLIQGSAACYLKKASVLAYEAGIFSVLIPHLTVHDELVTSQPPTKEGQEASRELTHYMETAYTLKVPVYAVTKTGKNWGEVKEVEL